MMQEKTVAVGGVWLQQEPASSLLPGATAPSQVSPKHLAFLQEFHLGLCARAASALSRFSRQTLASRPSGLPV